MAIDSVAKLRAVYRRPRARSGLKVLDHLDVHCRNFLALSPLCVISSSRADGRADASPPGDPPGSLAHVLDDRTLLLPDRRVTANWTRGRTWWSAPAWGSCSSCRA